MKGTLKYTVEKMCGGNYRKFPHGSEVSFSIKDMEEISFDGKMEVLVGGCYCMIPVHFIQQVVATTDEDNKLFEILAARIKQHEKICEIEACSEEDSYFYLDGEEGIPFKQNFYQDEFLEFSPFLGNEPDWMFTNSIAVRNLLRDFAVNTALEAGIEIYSIGCCNFDSWFALRYVDGQWKNIDGIDEYYSDIEELRKLIFN